MTESRRRPLLFFSLVLALSVPFLLAGAMTTRQLLPGVPASGLIFVCPALAAALLVYREGGARAVAALFQRSFDYRQVTESVWLLPILLVMPLVMLVSYGLMRLLERPLPPVEISLLPMAPMLLALFFAGLGEELGWSGYVIDPLQDRWGALRASLILGSVWATWHVVPLMQAGRAATWIAGWCVATVALRVLHTWLYNNTGKSVFGQALFHASANASWQLFPNRGSHYDPWITGLVLAVVAALVVGRWGPGKLTRQRNTWTPPSRGS